MANDDRNKTSIGMMAALTLLSFVTLALLALVAHGFATGWLIQFWTTMTDAQASIISQLIFLLGAAWASLLVPLLFGSQLQSLRAAADEARETFAAIKRQLAESAAESRRQFASISRYQQMALGFVSNEGVLSDFDDEQKKAFIETAWRSVEPKVTDALGKLHGRTRQWVSGGGRYRSNPWWERVKESGALGNGYDDFRTISDAKWSISRGTSPTFEQLKAVNDALQAVQGFVSPLDAEPAPPAAPEAPEPRPVTP